MWSDWLVVCDCGFSLSAPYCPLSVLAILLGFLLPWMWGGSSQLLQQSSAPAPYLGCGVAPLGRTCVLSNTSNSLDSSSELTEIEKRQAWLRSFPRVFLSRGVHCYLHLKYYFSFLSCFTRIKQHHLWARSNLYLGSSIQHYFSLIHLVFSV